MRGHRSSFRLLSLLAVAALAACESAVEPTNEAGPSFAVVGGGGDVGAAGAGTFIVLAEGNDLPASLVDDITALGGEITGTLPQIGVAFVRSRDVDFASALEGLSGVGAVAPDLLMMYDDPAGGDVGVDHGSATGAAAFDFLTWGIDAVGAPAAWAAGNRGAGVRVAVLDAGIDVGHPDLAPNINQSLSTSFFPCIVANCVGDVEDWRVTPGSYFNHGSHVAGTIAATGDLGVTGVAPEAELVVVKVCTEFFNACATSSILSGLVYAGDVGADLVNMSLGGLRFLPNDFVPYCRSLGIPASECGRIASQYVTGQDDYVQATILVYMRAFEYARQQGTTVLVAAGNNGMDADNNGGIKLAFADFPQTIAVSALGPLGWCLDPTTSVDRQAYYTNTGRSVIDVSAPGGNFEGGLLGPPYTDPCTVGPLTRSAYLFDGVFSTIAGGWGWSQGTSMATPHATGVAALIISGNGGSMSPAAVERALKEQAEDLGQPGHDPIYGAGRVTAGY